MLAGPWLFAGKRSSMRIMSESQQPDRPDRPVGQPAVHPSSDERSERFIARARDKAFVLYEGKDVPHRSCGIALAETFGLATPAYQSLRRGGITGCGTCGAVRAGEQILGELLGDPDPTGAVTDALRGAVAWYQAEVTERIAKRVHGGATPGLVCNDLTRPLGDFRGPERARFCTDLAAQVAEITAEALIRHAPPDVALEVAPIGDLVSRPVSRPDAQPDDREDST